MQIRQPSLLWPLLHVIGMRPQERQMPVRWRILCRTVQPVLLQVPSDSLCLKHVKGKLKCTFVFKFMVKSAFWQKKKPCFSNNTRLFWLAQKEGFEPSRPFTDPTPLAGEPLRPLGYFCIIVFRTELAEREGFEPPVPVQYHWFSRPAP